MGVDLFLGCFSAELDMFFSTVAKSACIFLVLSVLRFSL